VRRTGDKSQVNRLAGSAATNDDRRAAICRREKTRAFTSPLISTTTIRTIDRSTTNYRYLLLIRLDGIQKKIHQKVEGNSFSNVFGDGDRDFILLIFSRQNTYPLFSLSSIKI